MFLEGMTDTGDISVDLVAIGQTNTGNFPQCRVGLLGRCGKNTQAHSPPLRALGQIWRTASRLLGLTTLAYQLLNCRHATSASCFARRDPAASFTISFRAFGLLAFLPFCLFAFFSPARRTTGWLSGSEHSGWPSDQLQRQESTVPASRLRRERRRQVEISYLPTAQPHNTARANHEDCRQ